MPRHNRGNGNWSRLAQRAPRPAGLRGKQIGLYYRDQQRERSGNLPKKDFIIHFNVPPAVIAGLENNIKSILDLANNSNIPVRIFKGLSYIKKEEDCDYTSDKNFKSPSTVDSNLNKLRKIYSMSNPGTSVCSEHFCDVNAKPMFENTKSELTDTDNKNCIKTSRDGTEDIHQYEQNVYETTAKPIASSSFRTDDTSNERLLSLKGAGDFKYGYEDIITGSFNDKLDECLSNGITVIKQQAEIDDMCLALYQDYKDMLNTSNYKKYMQFRKNLPTYKKASDLLDVIANNQVIVISGETGCGKSTQVPQLILDDAIKDKVGGYVKILVTQPRRIAASSLAMRVAQERAEQLGASVGYAVRLERVDARSRGSIMFCTTGILLSALEVDQGLTNYTHVILDEVHERDCDIDLAMFMLKKVLQKRKDLKLILMSATIDADTLSAYFNNCPMIHIEGLAYPVKDVYMEEVLELTKYKLPPLERSNNQNNVKPWERYKKKKYANDMEKDIQYKAEIAPWLESVKRKISFDVYKTLQDNRIEELNCDLICGLLAHICKGPPGGILVFLPGITDISKVLRIMSESKLFPSSRYEIYPLHSKLPSLQQHQIFERPPENVRKIVIATNIAETSITIDDIVYVVDSGRLKYTGLNVEENVSTLQTEWVSQANLRQRRGRAGRCQPGICYHLLTTYRASKLAERLLPEMQRNALLEPVLSIKRLRLGKAAEALSLMPGPPADKTVQSAVTHLQQCGALDHAEKLTPLGWHLARLPVHPAAGKLMLLGALFGCLNRAVSVAAVWGFKDPFQLVIGKEDEVDEAKKAFALGEGSDHIAISEAIIQWENQSSFHQKRNFAYKNFLANNTLELLSDMKKQFGHNLKQMGFLPSANIFSSWENRHSDNLSLFKALIAAALYPNIAAAKWANVHGRNPRKAPSVKAQKPGYGNIQLHPSCVMATKPPKRGCYPISVCKDPGANWVVYWRQQQTSALYLFEVTLVHTLPLLFFGELTVTKAEDPDKCYITIASIKVCCYIHTAELLFQMRLLLDQVLASKIGVSSSHAINQNPFEEQVLNAVIELITAEDERAKHLEEGDDDLTESDSSEAASNTSWRK